MLLVFVVIGTTADRSEEEGREIEGAERLKGGREEKRWLCVCKRIVLFFLGR